MKIADKTYWNNRWENGETNWDIGYPSTPLKEYIDTLTDKGMAILIPGCGNAYEAEYLHRNGFTNVYVVDFAAKALADFHKRVPDFPESHLLHHDFFTLEGANSWELIFEQTFFCAIDPALRNDYARKMHELLAPAGRLVGLLFNDPNLNFEKPPFGGTEADYRAILSPYFTFTELRPADNSITPRAGREFFINLRKKQNSPDA